ALGGLRIKNSELDFGENVPRGLNGSRTIKHADIAKSDLLGAPEPLGLYDPACSASMQDADVEAPQCRIEKDMLKPVRGRQWRIAVADAFDELRNGFSRALHAASLVDYWCRTGCVPARRRPSMYSDCAIKSRVARRAEAFDPRRTE